MKNLELVLKNSTTLTADDLDKFVEVLLQVPPDLIPGIIEFILPFILMTLPATAKPIEKAVWDAIKKANPEF